MNPKRCPEWLILKKSSQNNFTVFLFSELNGCKFVDTPEVANGQLIVVRPYRGSVLRYKCHQGFKLFGQHTLHCQGNKWSSSQPPVCASKYIPMTVLKKSNKMTSLGELYLS